MFDQTVDLGTDVAALFVFHPDDLRDHGDDPLDWWTYDFSCRPELAAGHLIVFSTGGDGGYRLRLTDGELTEPEDAAKAGAWTFGFEVGAGRVLVDNGDCLPSDDTSSDPSKLPDRWVEIPNGRYKVTVQAIDRSDVDKKTADVLPDYVLRWEPTAEDLASLVRSGTPPRIEPIKGQEPRGDEGATPAAPLKRDSKPLNAAYPLLEADGPFLIPGTSSSYVISDALYDLLGGNRDIFADYDEEAVKFLVVSPTGVGSGMATVGEVTGLSRITGEPGRVTLRGEHLVRITGRADDKDVPEAMVEAMNIDDAPVPAPDVKALKEGFTAYIAGLPKTKAKKLGFEAKRAREISDGGALIVRLLSLLNLPARQCAELLTLPDPERARKLLSFLKAM